MVDKEAACKLNASSRALCDLDKRVSKLKLTGGEATGEDVDRINMKIETLEKELAFGEMIKQEVLESLSTIQIKDTTNLENGTATLKASLAEKDINAHKELRVENDSLIESVNEDLEMNEMFHEMMKDDIDKCEALNFNERLNAIDDNVLEKERMIRNGDVDLTTPIVIDTRDISPTETKVDVVDDATFLARLTRQGNWYLYDYPYNTIRSAHDPSHYKLFDTFGKKRAEDFSEKRSRIRIDKNGRAYYDMNDVSVNDTIRVDIQPIEALFGAQVPTNVTVEQIQDSFYYDDFTPRQFSIPSRTSDLVRQLRLSNEKDVDLAQVPEITVGKPSDFLNNAITWRVYAQKRLKESQMASLPTSYSFNKFALNDAVELIADMSDTIEDRQTLSLQVYDQGSVGSPYVNAMSILIYLNRIIDRLLSVKIVEQGSKFIYGYSIPSEDSNNEFFNYTDQFDTKAEALAEVIDDANSIETFDTPSRTYMQYNTKRRRSEIDLNLSSVLSQDMVLEILVESIRMFGVVSEYTYQYSEVYNRDPHNQYEEEEFALKFGFTPDAYIMRRGLLRDDTKSMQIVPVYIEGRKLFPDSYVSSPVIHTGLTTAQNKTLTLIKGFIANKMPLFLNWRLYTEYTAPFDLGNISPPTAAAIGVSGQKMFHTSVVTGYYDGESPSGKSGVIEIHGSWGCEEDQSERETGLDETTGEQIKLDIPLDNRGDDGVFYISYSDLFEYFMVSMWGICSDSWKHNEGQFEPYSFEDPDAFGSSINSVSDTLKNHFKARLSKTTRTGKKARHVSSMKLLTLLQPLEDIDAGDSGGGGGGGGGGH